MNSTVNSVLDEGMSIRRAALRHGIPKSSLGDKVSGRVMVDAQCGPATYLSQREETSTVSNTMHLYWLRQVTEGSLRPSSSCP